VREATTSSRSTRTELLVIAILKVDEIPEGFHLEGRCDEYADAVGIRAVDLATGVVSEWRTLPVKEGSVEVCWLDLWNAAVVEQSTSAA
jgi:hypothetical protein